MTNITQAQRGVLNQAAAAPEGAIDAPDDGKLIKVLIKNGLAIALPVEGGGSRLIITDAGRAAIALETIREESGAQEQAGSPEPATEPVAVEQEGDPESPAERGAEEPATSEQGALPECALEPAAESEGAEVEPSAEAATERPPKARPKGKLGALVALLQRPEGAMLEAMIAATGWQAHSVRGAMSGSLKKKLGFTIESEKTDGGRIYRIPAAKA